MSWVNARKGVELFEKGGRGGKERCGVKSAGVGKSPTTQCREGEPEAEGRFGRLAG